MSRSAALWKALEGQWPVLGVDPVSASFLRQRAEVLRLPMAYLVGVDWLASLLLFVAPFIGYLALGGGAISGSLLVLLLALGALLFIAFQKGARFLALLALGGNPTG
jgi:hypothetical protein